ncbi:MAG: RNA-guided endonuclease IscB, partial [Myxococcota bacterium]
EGVEYQQGTLHGYEVREYLLEKFQRTCVYCKAQEVPLQVEHIVPKSRGGSSALSNLTLACAKCNQKKSAQTAEEFGFADVQKQASRPLRDAAAVNSTRKVLVARLKSLGLPVACATGGQTKYNRTRQEYPKSHWLDAACVGDVGTDVFCVPSAQILAIHATGRGSRQMCRVDRYGFPRTQAKSRCKQVRGFQTGDLVRAKVEKGKKKGVY